MPESGLYQEVVRERYGDLAEELANPQTSKSQIAAIERKNYDEAFRAAALNARELIAHVVAQHRERFSENLRAGRRKAARRPYTTYAKRKPRVDRAPEPPPCRVEGHWAQRLLDYVRRDHETGRRSK